MKKIILLYILSTPVMVGIAQEKFYTKTGKIRFDANTVKSPDDVEAVNNGLVCVLDTKTGALQLSVVMKGFQFPKALMQEHFNENYMETQTYPKGEFKGSITNNASVNYSKGGVYKVKVSGNLTLHGVTKQIETNGELTVKDGKIIAKASFSVALADYKISIPSVVADKLSPEARVFIDCSLEVLNK